MSTNPSRVIRRRLNQRNHREGLSLARSIDRPSEEMTESPNPLLGLEECYHLHCKKSITTRLSGWRRWFVRWIYNTWEWSGDMCLEEMGTFTNREVARSLAAQRNLEAIQSQSGDVWEVRPSPINRILPYEPVTYGVPEYPATTIDDHYRAREPTQLAACRTVQELAVHFESVNAEVDKTLAMAKAAAGTL